MNLISFCLSLFLIYVLISLNEIFKIDNLASINIIELWGIDNIFSLLLIILLLFISIFS